jgi:hypothetical protein
MRTFAALVMLTALAGCSDIYYDRRETVAFGGNDAVASNIATQMKDPWPVTAANRNHGTDGAVMVTAVERYRTGRVIPPRGTGTSSSGYGAQQQNAAGPGALAPPAIEAK